MLKICLSTGDDVSKRGFLLLLSSSVVGPQWLTLNDIKIPFIICATYAVVSPQFNDRHKFSHGLIVQKRSGGRMSKGGRFRADVGSDPPVKSRGPRPRFELLAREPVELTVQTK